MSNFSEKIINSIVGGLGGFILLYILQSFDGVFFDTNNGMLVFILIPFCGIVTSLFIGEIKKTSKLVKNNERQSERISLFAHEMRTGQTSTSWAIDVILKKYSNELKDVDKSMLEGVLTSVRSAVKQSTNLLAITLLDVNKLKMIFQQVSLADVEKMFKETIANYVVGTQEKKIELISSITLDKNIKIEVDITRIRIILENILENAIQYAKGDNKKINITITNNSSNLNILIKDNGIGIPLIEQKNIFKEFYRAENAKKSLSSGSGIGLYLCSEYVKAHNGTISFDSVENEGTTFKITIPIKSVINVDEFLNKI